MSEEFDLNIENYELDDILNLFKLTYNFNEKEMKKAYRIALRIHPDKSKLPSEYFRFYMKAYNIVEKIFYFRNQRKKCTFDTVYNAKEIEDNDKSILLHAINGKSIREFNTWFNKMFEKVKIHDEETDNGYGEWINNNQVNNTNEKISLAQFGQVFEKKKTECKTLVKHSGINDIATEDGGYNLSREKINNYSSQIFSKLPYEDFKKAHTETVVPVNKQDLINKEKFNNIEQLKRHRDSQNVAPPSLQQSRQYLAEKTKNDTQLDSRRAFKILKRDEELEKGNNEWWSNLQLLTE